MVTVISSAHAPVAKQALMIRQSTHSPDNRAFVLLPFLAILFDLQPVVTDSDLLQQLLAKPFLQDNATFGCSAVLVISMDVKTASVMHHIGGSRF